jgi:hypothetical protein
MPFTAVSLGVLRNAAGGYPAAGLEIVGSADAHFVILLARTADAVGSPANDGVHTFVLEDGIIRVQTVSYTLQREVSNPNTPSMRAAVARAGRRPAARRPPA